MSGLRGRRDKIIYRSKFGFTLCQQNGQRTYGGPPPNWGSKAPPSRECEVFIGRLPRMCFEDELIPLFLTAGELYEFRLMLDFSGTNRGYGYAHYATLRGAQNAIENLHKYEIRPGHHIGVLPSKNNCRLLFGNIEPGIQEDTFSKFIRSATDQVLNVVVFKTFQQLKETDFCISSEMEEAFLGRVPRINGSSQFAIVEYENHKAAAVARRVLIPKYGHILAIDWAVPPRERKRFGVGPSSIERPLVNSTAKDLGALSVFKSNFKVRPVPVLLVQPSPLDNATFIPKTFKIVVAYFKYQLSVCLYKSVDQLEIPLFICKEVERKIVDRITNLENCSQAVQLIFNYFSWYNEKKRFVINTDVQKLLQEVKSYSDCFVFYLNKRLCQGARENTLEDHYYFLVLPLQLSIVFYVILRSDGEYQSKLSLGITKSLNWLMEVFHKGGKPSRELIGEIINIIKNEEGNTFEKASTLAKSIFLRNLSSQTQNLFSKGTTGLPSPKNSIGQTADGSQREVSANARILESHPGLNFHQEKVLGTSFPQIDKIHDGESSFFPPVQTLPVSSSFTNKAPFMPDIFNNVLAFFKYLIRAGVNVIACQVHMPRHISIEIEKKIIDRITNMENCVSGTQMILTYLSLCLKKLPTYRESDLDVIKLLQEVKTHALSFLNFVWIRSGTMNVINDSAENYFCKVLPLRLNLLFQMMVIFNSENPMRFFIGIAKGLNWLEEFIQNADKSAKQFLEDLTRFIVENDQTAYEKARNSGRAYCGDLMTSTGRVIACPMLENYEGRHENINASIWAFDGEISGGLSVASSESASDATLDNEP